MKGFTFRNDSPFPSFVARCLATSGNPNGGCLATRRADGCIEFAKGKHKGRLLSDIAVSKPDYLEWMLRGDFFDDTKAIVAEALARTTVGAD